MSKIPPKRLQSLAAEHGTPLVVVDHEAIRQNYATFKRHLPRVQAYYAVKANPAPEIVHTLYKTGASFDVASFPEFMLVYELIRRRPARDRQDFVWDKIVYANPVKAKETLEELNKYKPLVTFDNRAEIGKVAEHAPSAGLLVRLRVPNTGGSTDSISVPMRSISWMFAPDTLMPTGVRTPVVSMSMRALIGIVQALVVPGNLSASFISCTS